MGVEGFHSVLRPYLNRTTFEEFKGKKLAIDASAWLHRGIYSCAADIFKGNRWWEEAQCDPPYVDTCLKLIKMLQDQGAVPLLVFDGDSSPMKRNERERRKQKRQQAQDRAQGFLDREGPSPRYGYSREAQLSFGSAVEVTQGMARELQRALRREHVEFIVAPYEADSQLAYLCRTGQVAAVVTEDSDLVAFGCPHVIFKVDRNTCSGLKLSLEQLMKEGPRLEVEDAEELFKALADVLQFTDFSHEMVQLTAALSGCDYIDSLPSIGFKTAYKLVAEHKTVPAVVAALRKKFAPKPPKKPKRGGSSQGKKATQGSTEGEEGGEATQGGTQGKGRAPVEVPGDYEESLRRVLFAWSHAVVYDPKKPAGENERPGGLVHLTELPEVLPAWEGGIDLVVGATYDDGIAREVAKGQRSPHAPHDRLEPLPPAISLSQYFKQRKHQHNGNSNNAQHRNQGFAGGKTPATAREGGGHQTPLQTRGAGNPSTSAAVKASAPKVGPLQSLFAKSKEKAERDKQKEKESARAFGHFETPLTQPRLEAATGGAVAVASPAKAIQFTTPTLEQALAGGMLTSPVRKPRPKTRAEEEEEKARTPVLVAHWGTPNGKVKGTVEGATPRRSPIVRMELKALQEGAGPGVGEGKAEGRGKTTATPLKERANETALLASPGLVSPGIVVIGEVKPQRDADALPQKRPASNPNAGGKGASQNPTKKAKAGAGQTGNSKGQKSLTHFFALAGPSKK